MKYHILDVQPEPIFPQVNCLSLSEAHQLKYGEFPDFEPKLVFDLEPKAKLTDVLSQAAISASGILISNRMKNVLEECYIIDHTFFKAYIQNKGILYHWLHIAASPDIMNWIDFPNSEFYTTEYGMKGENIKLHSYNDYIEQKKKNGTYWGVKMKSIKLKIPFDSKIDLFVFPNLNTQIYISEKLKFHLQDIDASGIKIQEAQIS